MKLTHREIYRGHRIEVYERPVIRPVLGGQVYSKEEFLFINGQLIPQPTGPLGTTLAEDGRRIVDEKLDGV